MIFLKGRVKSKARERERTKDNRVCVVCVCGVCERDRVRKRGWGGGDRQTETETDRPLERAVTDSFRASSPFPFSTFSGGMKLHEYFTFRIQRTGALCFIDFFFFFFLTRLFYYRNLGARGVGAILIDKSKSCETKANSPVQGKARLGTDMGRGGTGQRVSEAKQSVAGCERGSGL